MSSSKRRLGAGFAFAGLVVAFAVSCTLTQGIDDYDRCAVGQKDCSGTCHSKTDPLFGCAAVDCTPCAVGAGAVAACDAVGACTAGTCNAGFATCGAGAAATATCAINTNTDPKNCGACGKVCQGENGRAAICVDGGCTTSDACAIGLQDCDLAADNGCECVFPNALAQCGTGGLSEAGTAPDSDVDASTSDGGDAGPIESQLDGGGGACTFGKCRAGFAHCAGDIKTVGCEVNTQTDENNCGACGKKCDGGACFGGVCQPFPLATNQANPGQLIFVDGAWVYWTNYAQNAGATANVAKVRLDGPPVIPVAPGLTNAWGIAEQGSEIFFTTQAGTAGSAITNTVGRAPKEPSGTNLPRALVTLVGRTRGIAVDPASNYVYFAVYDVPTTGTTFVQGIYRVDRVTTPTPAPELFAPAQKPNSILIDATNVYWTNEATATAPTTSGSVVFAAKNATVPATPTVVADNLYRTRGLALDADTIYWANPGTSAATRDGSVEKRRKDLSTAKVTLASGLSDSRELAIDPVGGYVYWASYKDNTLSRISKSANPGDVAELVAQNPVGGAASLVSPLSVAVDSKYVYWSNYGSAVAPIVPGSVMRLVKP